MIRMYLLLVLVLICIFPVFAQFIEVTNHPLVDDFRNTTAITWGDYNDDGIIDAYLTNWGQGNQLFAGSGDSGYNEVIGHILTSNYGSSVFSTMVDYNNDGLDDVFSNSYANSQTRLFKNLGGGNFIEILDPVLSSCWGNYITHVWFDYDNDSFIDLFLANGDIFGGADNRFLENNGNDSFTSITNTPFTADYGVCTYGGSPCDINGDGYIDVFMSTSQSNPDKFLLNDCNDSFFEVQAGDWAGTPSNTSSSTWVDFDNDGDFDLLVLCSGPNGGFSNLYKNNGLDGFATVQNSIFTQLEHTRSAGWGDLDNDGDIDFVNANWGGANNNVFINNGDGSFYEDFDIGLSQDEANRSSWGCSIVDYDNDGDLDIFFANGSGCINSSEYNQLYENRNKELNYIKFKCVGTLSNRSAIGAVIRCTTLINGQIITQSRLVTTNSGKSAQSPLVQHFGMGNATVVGEIEVTWPSGNVDYWHNLETNRQYTLQENSGSVKVDENPAVETLSKVQIYPNPFNPDTTIEFSIEKTDHVIAEIFNTKGQLIVTLENSTLQKGIHKLTWNGRNSNAETVASGIYFSKITIGDKPLLNKMVLLK